MPSLVDLFPSGDEVTCCTVLGLLLQADSNGGLLTEILRKVRLLDERREGLPWKESDLAAANVRDLSVSVEQKIDVGNEDRRLDLALRFNLGGMPYLVVIEAKVGAPGEHGRQIEAYERHLKCYLKRCPKAETEKRVLGVLLTAAPVDSFRWQSKPYKLTHFRGHLAWKDVCDAIQKRIESRDRASDLLARLGQDLVDRLEEWTLDLADLQNSLKQESAFCYPVLVDALEMVARRACGGEKLYKEPPGVEGAAWDEEEGAYWCGYWWQALRGWAALYLSWKYHGDQGSHVSSSTWVPAGRSAGYCASVQLERGRDADKEVEVIGRWSLKEFTEELPSLPDLIRERLKNRVSSPTRVNPIQERRDR